MSDSNPRIRPWAKIALARLFAVGVTVWLMQNYSMFRRLPGRPPRFFGYVLCGIL
jgi:hypothetical protein